MSAAWRAALLADLQVACLAAKRAARMVEPRAGERAAWKAACLAASKAVRLVEPMAALWAASMAELKAVN